MCSLKGIVDDVSLAVVMGHSMEELETYLCTDEQSAIQLNQHVSGVLAQNGLIELVSNLLQGLTHLKPVPPIIVKLAVAFEQHIRSKHYIAAISFIANHGVLGGFDWQQDLVNIAQKQLNLSERIHESLNQELTSFLRTHKPSALEVSQ